MSDPSILFVKPKAISAEDKKALRDVGVIVVEINSIADAKFTRAYAEVSAGDMLLAAAKAVGASELATKIFGAAICAAIASKKPA